MLSSERRWKSCRKVGPETPLSPVRSLSGSNPEAIFASCSARRTSPFAERRVQCRRVVKASRRGHCGGGSFPLPTHRQLLPGDDCCRSGSRTAQPYSCRALSSIRCASESLSAFTVDSIPHNEPNGNFDRLACTHTGDHVEQVTAGGCETRRVPEQADEKESKPICRRCFAPFNQHPSSR